MVLARSTSKIKLPDLTIEQVVEDFRAFYAIPINTIFNDYLYGNIPYSEALYLRLEYITEEEINVLSNFNTKLKLIQKKRSDLTPKEQFYLAEIYRYGIDVEKNIKTSIELYQLSSLSEAIAMLGYVYKNYPQYENINKSLKFYQESAAMGNAFAIQYIALDKTNQESKHSIFNEGIRLGSIHALYNMGLAWEETLSLPKTGIFLDQIQRKMLRYYSHSAARGHVLAMCKLGDLAGKLYKLDIAAMCYRAAVDKDNVTAANSLLELYEKYPENITICFHTSLAIMLPTSKPGIFCLNKIYLQTRFLYNLTFPDKLSSSILENFIGNHPRIIDLCQGESVEAIKRLYAVLPTSFRKQLATRLALSANSIMRAGLPPELTYHIISQWIGAPSAEAFFKGDILRDDIAGLTKNMRQFQLWRKDVSEAAQPLVANSPKARIGY